MRIGVAAGNPRKKWDCDGFEWHSAGHVSHSMVEECVLAAPMEAGERASDGTQGRVVADSRKWCSEESLPRAW